MQIGSLSLENNVILAPLAGISNLPFRLLAKEAGCGLVYSEMISAYGLVRQSKKTKQLLDSLPEEKPLSAQIFGSDPTTMAEAAKIVEANGADILDINFGCSVKKILKTGSGAALMKRPDLSEAVLKNVRKAVRMPLTIKMRTGWDKSGEQAINIAQIAEACGIDAIAVHPRTATQGFSGHADWSIIAAVKGRVDIPVIGNGDIFNAEDAIKMQAETGCDAVMIGRKAIGCPWIFSQVLAHMRGEKIPSFSLQQRFAIIRRYLHRSVKYLGEYRACLMMRSRLSWFVKGLPHNSQFRRSIIHISSENEALDLIDDYQQKLVQEAEPNG
ncbi:MAG: tRNA dihydrouridine synthase DusB [Desulfobacterales bacterium]|jgi:nifR3 family TIM-barrel protein